jgi:hypothetical protein
VTIDKDTFEREYAERSGMTIDELHAWGRFTEECSCGEDGCEGWAMGYQHEEALFQERVGRPFGKAN